MEQEENKNNLTNNIKISNIDSNSLTDFNNEFKKLNNQFHNKKNKVSTYYN